MFNLAVLIGRLTADAELKTTTNGVSVTSFSIAVDRPYRKDEERQADFINIVAWRGTAEFISRHFKKGDQIGIEGSIQTRRYTDKDGNKRTVFEVIANNVHFIGARQAETNHNGGADRSLNDLPDTIESATRGDFDEVSAMDGDLPF